MDNLTPFERWQLEKYGNYIPEQVPDNDLEWSAFEELNRLSEYFDNQLIEH